MWGGGGEEEWGKLQREGERKGKERKKKKEGKKERKKETKALCFSLSNLPGVGENGASWLFEWIWFIPDKFCRVPQRGPYILVVSDIHNRGLDASLSVRNS